MLYPRTTQSGQTVSEDEMVGFREHLNTQHRFVFLAGTIAHETDSCNLLLALDSLSHDPIKMVITSPGGSVDGAFFLYDTMKALKSPIYTLGRYTCSAATFLLAAGDKRYVEPHAKTMLHLPSAHFSGDVVELELQHKEMQKYKEAMLDIYIACGVPKTREEILKDIDREKWLDAQETIDYGLADSIMDGETMVEWLTEPEVADITKMS